MYSYVFRLSYLIEELHTQAVEIGYLDFSKTFDTVSHNILLGKLEGFGLVRYILHWVKNCLES